MSGNIENSELDRQATKTDVVTKYDVNATAADLRGVKEQEDEPSVREAEAEPTPEQNASATYDEVANLPWRSFGRTVNPLAWHPGWGPKPPVYENVVSRTGVLTADTSKSFGETADGQPLKQSVRSIKQGNYSNTPDGMGAEVGSGWTYDVPDWQLMERELAGDGVELGGSPTARVEAAHSELEAEEERRAMLPTREEVYDHYYVETTDVMTGEENAFTLGDELAEELEAETDWDLSPEAEMTMSEKWESVRQYTLECAERRVCEHREQVCEERVQNTSRRAFDRFKNGDRTPEAEMAVEQSAPHRRFSTRFTMSRYPEGHDPAWPEAQPETESVQVGEHTVEVSTEPVVPLGRETIQWVESQVGMFCLSRRLLDESEKMAVRLFDRNAECAGLAGENTFYEDLSDELDEGEDHPANEFSKAYVARDGSVPSIEEASAPGVPEMSRIRMCVEYAVGETKDVIDAVEPAMIDIWHKTATQPLSQVEPWWYGCTVEGVVTKAYVPNDPESQQQVFIVEDIAPSPLGEGQIGGEAKVTVWRQSNIDTHVSTGDRIRLSNAKPGQYMQQLTLACTADTTIDIIERGDGPSPSYFDAKLGKITGAADGHRPCSDDHPSAAKARSIDEEADKEVPRLWEKRLRPPEQTYHVGPPYEGKNTRAAKPMEEQRLPWTWTYPITEWVEENFGIDPEEETAGRDTEYEIAPITEPEHVLEDNEVEITPDEFKLAASRFDTHFKLPGGRYWEPEDIGISCEVVEDTAALGGGEEYVARIDNHPHAPDHLEIRVFSGIPVEGGERKQIRIVEWDTKADKPSMFCPKVSHSLGWEKRMLKTVRSIHAVRHDPEKPKPIKQDDEGTVYSGGVPVHNLGGSGHAGASPSDHPEHQPRRVYQNGSYGYKCPVCDFRHRKKTSVVAHMGGKAQDEEDPHRAYVPGETA